MTPKCQVCDTLGVGIPDLCPSCGWENEELLFIDDEKSMYVGHSLSPEAWHLYSYANRRTPISHKKIVDFEVQTRRKTR